MVVINTTFVAHKSVETEFVTWLKEVYRPFALSSGIFSNALLSKVLTEVDPEATSYAFQMRSDSLESAQKWHDEVAIKLHREMASKWGNNALFFTTYMEVMS